METEEKNTISAHVLGETEEKTQSRAISQWRRREKNTIYGYLSVETEEMKIKLSSVFCFFKGIGKKNIDYFFNLLENIA